MRLLRSNLLYCIICYIVFSMLFFGAFPDVSHANLAETKLFEDLTEDLTETGTASDMEKIKVVLEKKIITQRLKDLGISSEQIKDKLNSLSDKQLHYTASQIDNLYAGGSEGLSLIVSMSVIVFVIVIVLQLTGHKIIITKE